MLKQGRLVEFLVFNSIYLKKVIQLLRENFFEEIKKRHYALKNTHNLALSALFPLSDTTPIITLSPLALPLHLLSQKRVILIHQKVYGYYK